jgi:hypothetical protein
MWDGDVGGGSGSGAAGRVGSDEDDEAAVR